MQARKVCFICSSNQHLHVLLHYLHKTRKVGYVAQINLSSIKNINIKENQQLSEWSKCNNLTVIASNN